MSVLAAAALALSLSSAGAAQERQISIFGGIQFDNNWEDFFLSPAELEAFDPGLVGIAVGHDRRGAGPVSFGIELQAVQHFGEQHHLEFNVPVFVRYHPPGRIPVRSIGFGIGPSYATEVPDLEVERRGESRRFLVYWALEGEFASPDGRTSVFTRLHHRSGVFRLFSTDGASNALVIGLRRRW